MPINIEQRTVGSEAEIFFRPLEAQHRIDEPTISQKESGPILRQCSVGGVHMLGEAENRTTTKPDVPMSQDVSEYRVATGRFLTYLPKPQKTDDRFRLLQKFEGTVLEITDTGFWARIVNKTDPHAVEEEAEFPFEEVPEQDRPLISEGAVFYWSIGAEQKAFGQVIRSSVIRFRRLPRITNQDLQDAKLRSSFLRRLLNIGSGNGSSET
jgi:hypothetical protein